MTETNQPTTTETSTAVTPTTETTVTSTPTPEPVIAQPTETSTVVEAPKPETVIGEALEKTEPVKEAPKVEEQKTEPPKEDTKTEPVTEIKPEEVKPPIYEDFKIPDGVTVDQDQVKAFTDILSELESKGKTDHALVQEFGQKAVDFHIAEQKKLVERIDKTYIDAWNKQKQDWKETFLKDPEMGGNRWQTTVDSALNFIRTHGGTPEQQTEFKQLMENSGLGNHPAMIRLLANAGRAMSEGTPLAATTPVPASKSRTETLYGKSK